MRAIRNITDEAVALGITKFPSTEDILSRLQSDSSLNKERVYLSKKEWAAYLNFHPETIARWEREIIAPNLFYRVNYWGMKGDIKKLQRFQSGKSMGYRLDYFQRFVIALIRAIKLGCFTHGLPMAYNYEVIAWLDNTPEGQKVKTFFDRDVFFQSQAANNKRRNSA